MSQATRTWDKRIERGGTVLIYEVSGINLIDIPGTVAFHAGEAAGTYCNQPIVATQFDAWIQKIIMATRCQEGVAAVKVSRGSLMIELLHTDYQFGAVPQTAEELLMHYVGPRVSPHEFTLGVQNAKKAESPLFA